MQPSNDFFRLKEITDSIPTKASTMPYETLQSGAHLTSLHAPNYCDYHAVLQQANGDHGLHLHAFLTAD
jgi:hypothetical protein